MDNRVKENYKKALKLYTGGEINKALKICNECMAETLKFAPVINLKGLILYQKGNLEEAISTWKINREVNDDMLSKNYIKDAKEDEERVILYLKAEDYIKELKITEALEVLIGCSESDFNSIKVNTALALCYLKKGEYPLCREHINKVLSIDKNNIETKEIKKELSEVYDEVKNNSNKKAVGIVILICVLLGSGVLGMNYLDKGKANDSLKNEKPVVKEEIVKSSEEKKKEDTKENKKSLDLSKLNNSINNKNMKEIYYLIDDIDENSLSEKEKEAYYKGLKILKKDGAIEFYNNGQILCSERKYKEAIEELKKANKYGKDIYIYEHVLYYLGLSEIGLKNDAETIKYFKEYESKFSNGVYIQEVLYNLALLNNKSGNLEEAKKYAERLKSNFSKSIYNNEKINKIIEK